MQKECTKKSYIFIENYFSRLLTKAQTVICEYTHMKSLKCTGKNVIHSVRRSIKHKYVSKTELSERI